MGWGTFRNRVEGALGRCLPLRKFKAKLVLVGISRSHDHHLVLTCRETKAGAHEVSGYTSKASAKTVRAADRAILLPFHLLHDGKEDPSALFFFGQKVAKPTMTKRPIQHSCPRNRVQTVNTLIFK